MPLEHDFGYGDPLRFNRHYDLPPGRGIIADNFEQLSHIESRAESRTRITVPAIACLLIYRGIVEQRGRQAMDPGTFGAHQLNSDRSSGLLYV